MGTEKCRMTHNPQSQCEVAFHIIIHMSNEIQDFNSIHSFIFSYPPHHVTFHYLAITPATVKQKK